MHLELDGQPRRFYDGGTPQQQPRPDEPPTIVLERTLDMSVHEFRMGRRLGYRDRRLGELLVPADLDAFVTDLASVPSIFGWLVPRTGRHLPAALLHDALVGSPEEPASYLSAEDVAIDREEANLVFRDAMADTGTGVVRRWLMWTAVTIATMVLGGGTSWSRAERWRWRVTALGTLAVVVVLGFLATLDLFDLRVAGLPGVPWMGAAEWRIELLTGAAGAVVIPFVLGLFWGRFYVAGIVTGVGVALLLHVTVAVVALTLLYRVVEWLASTRPALALAAAAVVIAASTVVFVAALL